MELIDTADFDGVNHDSSSDSGVAVEVRPRRLGIRDLPSALRRSLMAKELDLLDGELGAVSMDADVSMQDLEKALNIADALKAEADSISSKLSKLVDREIGSLDLRGDFQLFSGVDSFSAFGAVEDAGFMNGGDATYRRKQRIYAYRAVMRKVAGQQVMDVKVFDVTPVPGSEFEGAVRELMDGYAARIQMAVNELNSL